jgi:hypothetical protein
LQPPGWLAQLLWLLQLGAGLGHPAFSALTGTKAASAALAASAAAAAKAIFLFLNAILPPME